MGAGGVIQKQVMVLLTAVTDSCMYDVLSDEDKDIIETINAKDRMSYTQDDVDILYDILGRAKNS